MRRTPDFDRSVSNRPTNAHAADAIPSTECRSRQPGTDSVLNHTRAGSSEPVTIPSDPS